MKLKRFINFARALCSQCGYHLNERGFCQNCGYQTCLNGD